MRQPLRHRVPPMPGESTASLASRLAARNLTDMLTFCRDMGISFDAVVNGRKDVVQALVELAGVGMSPFVDGVMTKSDVPGARSWLLRGQRLTVETVRRAVPHACPLCLSEDIRDGVGKASELAYARSVWSIEQLRTCPEHHVALINATLACDWRSAHDNQALYGDLLRRLPEACRDVTSREPSGLEQYLLRRISHSDGGVPWLDTMPFNVVALLVERVGVVLRFGRKTNLLNLSGTELAAAGQTGFDALRDGEDGLRAVLDQLRGTYPYGASGAEGPQAVFGRLWHFLDRGSSGAEFEPLKRIVRNHVMGQFPFAAGTRVLGQAVERRRLHSIRSASLETGRHPVRLRRLLLAGKVIDEGKDEVTDNLVVFDAERADKLLSRVAAPMSTAEAKQALGVPRLAPLVRDGVVVPLPCLEGRRQGKAEFAREEIQRLLKSVVDRISVVDVAPPGFFDLHTVTKKTKGKLGEVITLLREGRIERVRRIPDRAGFAGVLVCLEEVSELVRGEEHGGWPESSLANRMHIDKRAVRKLIDHGKLSVRMARNPANRCLTRIVLEEDVKAFEASYVSLFSLAKERGVYFKKLKSDLQARGISPVLTADDFVTPFYERSSL